MQNEKKPHFYLFHYQYENEQNLHYRFIMANGKIEAKRKFVLNIDKPLSFYDFKKTNNLPLLVNGDIMDETIQ